MPIAINWKVTPMPIEVIPRPEPVLDEASIAGKVGALVTALGGVAVVLGLLTVDDVSGLAASLVGLVAGVCAVVNLVVPVWRARFARAKVTPLVDPVNAAGTPLVPVG